MENNQLLTESQYRSRPELSYSDLVWLEKSPQHFKNRDALRKESEAMRLGTLLHLGVLEPKKLSNAFALEPSAMPDGTEINRRVKAHREFLAGWKQTNEGRIFIREEDYELLTAMLNALSTHNHAHKYLSGGASEVVAFGEFNGVKLKGRADYIVDHPHYGRCVVDLKKTQDASKRGFEKSIWNYRYHLQMYIYKHLFKAQNCIWVCVESGDVKVVPIGIYRCHEVYLEKAEELLIRLTDKYKQCLETNNWHGYTDDIEDVFPPSWVVGANEQGEI